MLSRKTPRTADAYVWAVTALGAAAILWSVYQLIDSSIGYQWYILAALTLISGCATVKLPSVPATISVSETFVFTSVLLFGVPAGTVTVALDGLVISLWLARRQRDIRRLLFNVSAPALSLWIAATVFYSLTQIRPLVDEPARIQEILPGLVIFTLSYFLLDSWLITFAISSETRLPPFKIWRENFAWVVLNFFSGASVALLLVIYTRHIELTVLGVIVPLLLVLYFTFKTAMGRVEDANKHVTQLNSLYLSTIETLAMAIDAKDQVTHGHIRRVQVCAVGLARQLGAKDQTLICAIEAAALLHDMGKLAVPEYILNKPGKLTPAEFEKMKLHASVGADILSAIDFPYPVVPIVRHHHENWDGTGYPSGLKGTDIPLGARILSVVDCFDALTSDRPYRPKLSEDDAIKILVERRGRMYDPVVVDTFIRVHSDLAPQQSVGTTRSALWAISEAAHERPQIFSQQRRHDDVGGSIEATVTLYELTQSLTGGMTLADVGEMLARHLRRLIPASLCVFFAYDIATDELVAAHASGENTDIVRGLRVPLGQRLTGWVAANRQTILNSDPTLDLGPSPLSLQQPLRSSLSTPLVLDSQLVGALTLYGTQPDAFTEDHRRLLEVVAQQVCTIVHRAIQFEDERRLSCIDPITGLPNARQLSRLAVCDGPLASRFGAPTAIVVIRVLGAPVGAAEPFRAAAASVRRVLRGGDLLFRCAETDFIVLLPQTPLEAAASISERIRAAILAQLAPPGSATILSVAIGIAVAPSEGARFQDLIELATSRTLKSCPHSATQSAVLH